MGRANRTEGRTKSKSIEFNKAPKCNAQTDVEKSKWMKRSRDISVSVVSRLRAGRPAFNSRQGQDILFVCLHVHTGSGAHTNSYLIGTRGSSPGVKWSGSEAGHQLQSPYIFRAWCLVKCRILFHGGAKIAQRFSAGLRAGWSKVRVLVGTGNFSLHCRVHTGCGAHPSTYPMGTRGSLRGGKSAGAWSWPLNYF
jgi:hypothetical protein